MGEGKRKKKRSRGNGEGSIYQLENGTWRGHVTRGYNDKGRQIKKWFRGRTRRDVAKQLNQYLMRSGSRLISMPEKVTVREWLERYALEKEVKEKTRESYHWIIHNHVFPVLGEMQLSKVTPLHLRQFHAALTEKELSADYRRKIYYFLNGAFRTALRVELIERNPVKALDPPKSAPPKETPMWTAKEAAAFMKHVKEERLYNAYYIMLALGLRAGECFGLMWDDLEGDALHIRRTLTVVRHELSLEAPKTPSSLRTLYLSPDQIEIFRCQREQQRLERSTAKRWMKSNLIFTSNVGTPLSFRNVRRRLDQLTDRAAVTRIGLHGFRHTYATLALLSGLPLKVVSERLGHSDIRVTSRIYEHIHDKQRRAAALSLDELLEEVEK